MCPPCRAYSCDHNMCGGNFCMMCTPPSQHDCEDTEDTKHVVEKTQLTFLARLCTIQAQPTTTVPPLLLEPGNCILLSFWHLLPDKRPVIESFVEETESDQLTCRSYKDCASVCGVTLAARPGFHPAQIGCCLIHSDPWNHSHGMGGHCIGVSCEDAAQMAVYVQASVATLWAKAMLGLVSSSIDKHTVVTFEIIRDGAVDESAGPLLNMKAGGDGDDEGEELDEELDEELGSLDHALQAHNAHMGVLDGADPPPAVPVVESVPRSLSSRGSFAGASSSEQDFADHFASIVDGLRGMTMASKKPKIE